ncbi:pyruvate ferredoxin oxidoreductase [Candidatus Cryosericum odellii]|jgi:pyruvate ferredoxin oxidoreductase alpha subunit|uniref:Pyruvate ferredoxin oxidoreductase n=1 Tax=Candidatus Cryosericum odellii TaxID=2290917 RepID=A0A398DIG8_9BACT|nr:pyruvate ferredoxin oxidoreductase [Candidatus Cryosericum odellii]RIE10047.1 pyruvate ferredoxin oxidoreductase [Candidatus Cryosericum odellii]RIE14590.1 pyruvate ferredoxin oxidoreductase [Candidatus Cryosericum odellii]
MGVRKAITGAEAAAEAMRQINPDVVVAYPITPQTPIVEQFAKYVADGIVDTEMVPVESEHSAMSATVGAEAAGARAMSATSSQGLALMWEIVAATPGLRLPIVMPLVNRTISAPLNIHCDHSDVMGITTLGWIQIFSENAQEVYENLLLAIRVAEDTRVQLPAMVNQDGFITSHAVEPVEIFDDAAIRAFVGVRSLDRGLLDLQHVRTVGAMVLPDYLLEVKRAEEEAMKGVFEVYAEVGKELSAITGRQYPFFETYRTDDADAVIVVLNSAAGTAKVAVDAMRAQGKKVGLLKPILFRPFPYAEVRDALKDVPVVGVLDRSMDFGAYAPVYTEIRNVLYELDKRPATQSYIYGLGGRDIMTTEIETVFEELLSGNLDPQHQRYIGLRG